MPDLVQQHLFVTSGVFSSTNPVFQALGFHARQLTIRNRSAVSVYVNLKSTAASTSDFEVLSSGDYTLGPFDRAIGLTRYALHTSATSTAAAARVVNVLAIG